MKLADSKLDSLLVYHDWLIDNNREKEAEEILEEPEINAWFIRSWRTMQEGNVLYFFQADNRVGSNNGRVMGNSVGSVGINLITCSVSFGGLDGHNLFDGVGTGDNYGVGH